MLRQLLTQWFTALAASGGNEWINSKPFIILNLTEPTPAFQRRVLAHTWSHQPRRALVDLHTDLLYQLWSACCYECTRDPVLETYLSASELAAFPCCPPTLPPPTTIDRQRLTHGLQFWLKDCSPCTVLRHQTSHERLKTWSTIQMATWIEQSVRIPSAPLCTTAGDLVRWCHKRKIELATWFGEVQLKRWKSHTQYDALAQRLRALSPQWII